MDGGAWWAAVYGVAQSRTQLKRLSSSMLSEISQTEKDKYCMIPLTLNIKSRFTEPEITMVMFPETRRRQKIGSC